MPTLLKPVMFGIVLANIDSLDESERDRYREVYCGICHSLKERHGQVSRICTNYDMVLLALLRESLFEFKETVFRARCVLHPAKEHRFAQGKAIDYAADISLILAYHKCLDDWQDDRRKAAKAYSSAIGRSYERMKQAYPGICTGFERELAAVRGLEANAGKDAMANADAIAKRFGATMALVFSHDGGHWSEELAVFGAELGRFIYFMDAALDRADDAQSGSYNPFNKCATSDEDVELLLMSLLGRATGVFERLPLERDLHLMRSVLYAGVWQKIRSQQQAGDAKGGK